MKPNLSLFSWVCLALATAACGASKQVVALIDAIDRDQLEWNGCMTVSTLSQSDREQYVQDIEEALLKLDLGHPKAGQREQRLYWALGCLSPKSFDALKRLARHPKTRTGALRTMGDLTYEGLLKPSQAELLEMVEAVPDNCGPRERLNLAAQSPELRERLQSKRDKNGVPYCLKTLAQEWVETDPKQVLPVAQSLADPGLRQAFLIGALDKYLGRPSEQQDPALRAAWRVEAVASKPSSPEAQRLRADLAEEFLASGQIAEASQAAEAALADAGQAPEKPFLLASWADAQLRVHCVLADERVTGVLTERLRRLDRIRPLLKISKFIPVSAGSTAFVEVKTRARAHAQLVDLYHATDRWQGYLDLAKDLGEPASLFGKKILLDSLVPLRGDYHSVTRPLVESLSRPNYPDPSAVPYELIQKQSLLKPGDTVAVFEHSKLSLDRVKGFEVRSGGWDGGAHELHFVLESSRPSRDAVYIVRPDRSGPFAPRQVALKPLARSESQAMKDRFLAVMAEARKEHPSTTPAAMDCSEFRESGPPYGIPLRSDPCLQMFFPDYSRAQASFQSRGFRLGKLKLIPGDGFWCLFELDGQLSVANNKVFKQVFGVGDQVYVHFWYCKPGSDDCGWNLFKWQDDRLVSVY